MHKKQTVNYQGPYPNEVPADVAKELAVDQNEMELKSKKLCLNCVPGLRGKDERQQFVIKVYGVLICQLAITVGFVTLTMVSDRTQEFMKEHKWLYWTAFAGTFTLIMFLFCFNFLVRKVPWNYLILFVFTLFDTYMIGSISIF